MGAKLSRELPRAAYGNGEERYFTDEELHFLLTLSYQIFVLFFEIRMRYFILWFYVDE